MPGPSSFDAGAANPGTLPKFSANCRSCVLFSAKTRREVPGTKLIAEFGTARLSTVCGRSPRSGQNAGFTRHRITPRQSSRGAVALDLVHRKVALRNVTISESGSTVNLFDADAGRGGERADPDRKQWNPRRTYTTGSPATYCCGMESGTTPQKSFRLLPGFPPALICAQPKEHPRESRQAPLPSYDGRPSREIRPLE